MKIEKKRQFLFCLLEAQARSLGREIVCKNEKPTFSSAWSSGSADIHTKVVYERVDKHFKVTN